MLVSDTASQQTNWIFNMVFTLYRKIGVILGIVIMFNTDSYEGKRNRHRHGDDETEGIAIHFEYDMYRNNITFHFNLLFNHYI